MNREEIKNKLLERSSFLCNNQTPVEMGVRRYIKEALTQINNLDSDAIDTVIKILRQYNFDSLFILSAKLDLVELVLDTINFLEREKIDRKNN